MSETLRINGLGRVTDDANLLTPSAVQGYPPKIGIVVEVREVFLHFEGAEPRRPLGSQAPYQSAGFGKQYRDADRSGRWTDARGE
jgi:uncharacterized protein